MSVSGFIRRDIFMSIIHWVTAAVIVIQSVSASQSPAMILILIIWTPFSDWPSLTKPCVFWVNIAGSLQNPCTEWTDQFNCVMTGSRDTWSLQGVSGSTDQRCLTAVSESSTIIIMVLNISPFHSPLFVYVLTHSIRLSVPKDSKQLRCHERRETLLCSEIVFSRVWLGHRDLRQYFTEEKTPVRHRSQDLLRKNVINALSLPRVHSHGFSQDFAYYFEHILKCEIVYENKTFQEARKVTREKL